MRTAIAFAAGLVAAGCALEAQAPLPVTELDPAFYEASVHPMVAESCATLDCHGQDGRPLRLYAEDGLRASDALRGEPLSPGELDWNVEVFEVIDPGAAVDQSVVLTKPLAVDAGGLHHLGDPVWASRDDPGYRCLRTWMAGELDPAPCAEVTADP